MRHCERALFEAYDSAIFYRLDQFATFTQDYKDVVVSDVVADYVGMVQKMQEARKLLESARSSTTDREKYYGEVESKYRDIERITSTLEAARDELNKVRRANDSVPKRFRVQPLITFLAAVLGAAAMLLSRAWFK